MDLSGIPRIGFAQHMQPSSVHNPQSITRPPDSQVNFLKALKESCEQLTPEVKDEKKPSQKRRPKKTSRDENAPRRMSRQSRHEPRK